MIEYGKKQINMKSLKLIGIFLAVLLVLFILKGVFFGIFLFTIVLKYIVIAALVAGVIYLFNRKSDKEE
jgi:hypothetical protein